MFVGVEEDYALVYVIIGHSAVLNVVDKGGVGESARKRALR